MSSFLWKAFLATLRRLGEPTLADYLQTYERPLPAIFKTQYTPDIVFASFWVGLEGIIPGSESGSEPAEVIHASWQREWEQLGGRGGVGHALHVLQNLSPTIGKIGIPGPLPTRCLLCRRSSFTISEWRSTCAGWSHDGS